MTILKFCTNGAFFCRGRELKRKPSTTLKAFCTIDSGYFEKKAF